MRRTLITMLLVASSLAVVFALTYHSNQDQVPAPREQPKPAEVTQDHTPQPPETETPGPAEAPKPKPEPPAPKPDQPLAAVGELIAIDPGRQAEPVIGSSEPEDNPYKLRASISPWNAGIAMLDLADYSDDALEHKPYHVQQKLWLETIGENQRAYHYPFGARSITINGKSLNIDHKRWQLLSDPDARENGGVARFQLTIAEARAEGEAPKPLVRLERTFRLRPGRYDLQLQQEVVNLTDQPLEVTFVQFGPGDMQYKPSYMGDRRGLTIAHVDPEYDAQRRAKSFDSVGGQGTPRMDVIKDGEGLWPNEDAREREAEVGKAPLEVAYAALSNRYFVAAAMPLVEDAPEGQAPRFEALNATFPKIDRIAWGSGDTATLLLTMRSRPLRLDAGGSASLDVALYAGPKSRQVFDANPLYVRYGLDRLIVYETGCCLSFNGIANFLHWLLDVFHVVVRDWGLAIMVLTIIVRAILHPITRKSQLNMMRFTKEMQKLQPEIEKLKKKHKDDSQKLNQEMMKLYRERNVNPAGMAMGCLPMFLQTPIWIALWAMLFYAIDLRHTPAFFDAFHRLGASFGYPDWRFLTDLADKDRFIPLPESVHFTAPLVGRFEAINLLPIMLLFTYWAQQKFMQPPQTTELSDQAKTQQKMMKLMLLSFPIILFNAPSGLTLYMLASSISGIIDGKIIRKKLKQMEERGEFDKPRQRKEPKPGGFLDRMQKAAEAKQREMQEMQRRQAGGGKGKKRRR